MLKLLTIQSWTGELCIQIYGLEGNKTILMCLVSNLVETLDRYTKHRYGNSTTIILVQSYIENFSDLLVNKIYLRVTIKYFCFC